MTHYMYTTTPIPDFIASSYYTPTIAIIICAVFVIGFISTLFDSVKPWVVFPIIVGYGLHTTVFSGVELHYENTKVIGVLENIFAEQTTTTSGKHTTTQHMIYARYNIEDSVIVIPINQLEAVPKHAYFYKNPTK